MHKKIIPWLGMAMLGVWFSTNAPARPPQDSYYLIYRVHKDTTADQLVTEAHWHFQHGLAAEEARSFNDNAALNVYNAIRGDEGAPIYPILHADREAAEQAARNFAASEEFSAEVMVIHEVAPDDRAFNYQRTVDQLAGSIPNQDPYARMQIYRTLEFTPRDIGSRALVAGMPLPTDITPFQTLIEGRHIRRAFIYRNNELWRTIERSADDGPFLEPSATHTEDGYVFNPSPLDFPYEHAYMEVAASTDNLTFAAGCRPYSAPPRVRAGPSGWRQSACKAESIDLQTYIHRHVAHRGMTVAALELLL